MKARHPKIGRSKAGKMLPTKALAAEETQLPPGATIILDILDTHALSTSPPTLFKG